MILSKIIRENFRVALVEVIRSREWDVADFALGIRMKFWINAEKGLNTFRFPHDLSRNNYRRHVTIVNW